MRECKQVFALFFPFPHVSFGRARILLYLLCKFDGLKSSNLRSRPTRGAWIEIAGRGARCCRRSRRAPHGARGLKSVQRLPGSSPTQPKTTDAPGCKCSPGHLVSKEGMLCRKDEIGSARAPSRNGGRGTMKDQNETSGPARFQMRGCVQHKTNCATRKATEPQFRGFLPHLCVFVV